MKALKSFVLAAVLFVGLFSYAGDKFPTGPNPQTTPGALCTHPDSKRYAEQIDYCVRNVSTQLKNELIKMYDQQFGYSIRTMNRGDFKIDHFIPLSIGGANDKENLWPQHKSVYGITDPLESLLSEKMVAGRMKQADAIRVIREAKLNLGRVPDLIHYVKGL
ncbi:MAG: HNH endonuclease [Bdellovibrio sp.]|nr:HNH endonuclease [Bdellovibrio sp.]